MRNPVVVDGVEPQELQSGVIESSQSTANPEEILTYKEAARLLKISARTLERWTREGLIPYIRLPERGTWSGVRFSRKQLLRWLRQRTVRER
jgi:excisionase family DNA binding protein